MAFESTPTGTSIWKFSINRANNLDESDEIRVNIELLSSESSLFNIGDGYTPKIQIPFSLNIW